MIVHSEQINELAAALAAAQQEMENARKNSANPHFKSSYADLGEILNTVRQPLSKHGLSLVQMPAYEDGVVTVETLLMHASGQWLRGSCSAAVQKADPQGIGSATTYLRRYSAASICGIAQEDDDGNAAGVTAPARKAEEPAATDKQVALIRRMYASHVITDEERVSLEKRIGNGFTASKAKAAIDWLTKEVDTRKKAEKAEATELVEV